MKIFTLSENKQKGLINMPIENEQVSEEIEEQEQEQDQGQQQEQEQDDGRPEGLLENFQQEESEQEENEEPQYSDEEVEAMEMGWNPKDKFTGKEERWVTAHQFLDRERMGSKISKQAAELEELKQMNKTLFSLVQEQKNDKVNQEAEKLLALKREAIAEGDIEKAEKYEAEFYKLASNKTLPNTANTATADSAYQDPTPKKQYSSEVTEAVKVFVAKNNSWYNNSTPLNNAMVAYANDIERKLEITNPELPIAERLNRTERAVKMEFSQVFTNENRKRAPTVESNKYKSRANSGEVNKKKITYRDLPNDAKQVIAEMRRQYPQLDVDKYAQDLLDEGAIAYE
jgi:hypothetical protein